MGIETDEMGVGIIYMLMEGKLDTTNIPQMDGLDDTGRDGIGLMELMDNKEDITGMSHVAFVNGLDGLNPLCYH